MSSPVGFVSEVAADRPTGRGWLGELLPEVAGPMRSGGESRRLLIILGAGSLFSVLMLAARRVYYVDPGFRFLLWNLLLAWVPMLFAVALSHLHRRGAGRMMCLAAAGGWLAFFPNAPYLCTDLLHLHNQPPVPHWYDALMLTSFSWNGLLLGFASLQLVHGIAGARRSPGQAWALAVAALFLAGFGIYLGRFERWNSWDVLTNPLALGRQVFDPLLHPWLHLRTWGVTGIFGCFLTLAYVGLLGLAGRSRGTGA